MERHAGLSASAMMHDVGYRNERRDKKLHRWTLLLLAWLALDSLAGEKPWIWVDTQHATLSVMQGTRTILKLSNIAIGRGGVTTQRVKDDNRTPLGSFRITTINSHSVYYRFYGLNYPTLEYAFQAWKDGTIDYGTYRTISEAIIEHRLPPQDTSLGGHLGIHGLGKGDSWVHRNLHWTRGCIALTNQQIDALAPWIEVGTQVVID